MRSDAARAAVDYARGEPLADLPGGTPSPGLRTVNHSGKTKVSLEGRCRLCGSRADLTRHHLVPEVWFRLRKRRPILWRARSADPNIIPLCRRCHDRVEEYESARRALRSRLGIDELAFVIQTIGRPWLEQTYPAETARNPRRRRLAETVSAAPKKPPICRANRREKFSGLPSM